MKRAFFVIPILIPIIFPATSLAIRFDIWETGMSINEVVSLASQLEIAIASESWSF
jgi:hypothetical protein